MFPFDPVFIRKLLRFADGYTILLTFEVINFCTVLVLIGITLVLIYIHLLIATNAIRDVPCNTLQLPYPVVLEGPSIAVHVEAAHVGTPLIDILVAPIVHGAKGIIPALVLEADILLMGERVEVAEELVELGLLSVEVEGVGSYLPLRDG